MTKQEATQTAAKLQACLDAYFKNSYVVHRGKHWKARQPDDHSKVARNSITVNCAPAKIAKGSGMSSFRVKVVSAEPKFVDARFDLWLLDSEIKHLFDNRIIRVADAVDLRNSQFYLVYQVIGTSNTWSINFQLDN